MVRGRVGAEMGYIWAVLGTGNTSIVNDPSGAIGGGLGHGGGECSDYKTSGKGWEGKKRKKKRLAAHQHELPYCSWVGLWVGWSVGFPVDFARLHTRDHVKTTELSIPLLILFTTQHSAHNLSADAETGSTESVVNTDAMPRPADTIVPHSMSEHDRRFLFFFSLEGGM